MFSATVAHRTFLGEPQWLRQAAETVVEAGGSVRARFHERDGDDAAA
jgi:hypothetical protein